jgi:eukaryotic-like serine/threonine-protein kinase
MSGQDTLQQVQVEALGRYRVLRRLGRGGMGEVWLCDDERLNRQVAVKTLPARNQQDKAYVQRFAQEAKAAAALHHPHILSVLDYGQQELPNGTVLTYIVMPYVSGGSLAERATYYSQQKRLMPTEEALTFLTQMAEAIDYAHKQHIIHRDIKPDNMLLRDENWLLLADFGIARMVSSDQPLTTTSRGFGTPEFMAPEQARGRADVTSDNYSLAVVAYLLLTGHLPFQGDTAIATVMQHVIEPPSAPRQFNPLLSPACEQVLLQGLAKDPAQRPALAQEFVTQLARAIRETDYRAGSFQTVHDLPELAFKESLPALSIQAERVPLSRRQLLLGSALAATALVGLGSGAWGIARDLSPANTMQLPAQASVSARPSVSGANRPLLVLTGHSQPADSLLWSHDSRLLISGGLDNLVLRWDIMRLLQQPTRPALTPLYTNQLRCSSDNLLLAWSPDQSRLVIANQNQGANGVDTVICTSDLKIQARFTLQSQTGGTPAFTGITWPSTRYIVFSSREQTSTQPTSAIDLISAIDVEHLQQRWPIVTEQNPARDVITKAYNALIPAPVASNGLLGVVHEKDIVVGQLDVATDPPAWRQKAKINMTPPQNSANIWSADGAYLIGTNTEISTFIYTPWQTGKQATYKLTVPDTSDGNAANITYLTTNPASLSPGVAGGTFDGSVYLWNFRGGAAPVRKLDTGGVVGRVQAIGWSPDGRWLAASFYDQNTSILVWKLA